MPASVTLPDHIWNDGQIAWPGQDAGFLGLKHDPWLLHCDPSEPKFHVDALALPDEMTQPRFVDRRALLNSLNRKLDRWAETQTKHTPAMADGREVHLKKPEWLHG